MKPAVRKTAFRGLCFLSVILALYAAGPTRTPLAQEHEGLTPEEALIRAMTLCPEPDNPISNGVRALGGNLLVNIHLARRAPGLYPLIVTADVINTAQPLDHPKPAQDSHKGQIRVEMGYHREGGGKRFYCKLEVLERAG